MKIIKTKFKNLVVFKGVTHKDKRGFFREIVIEKIIKNKLKFYVVSKSKKNVLRGLHFQTINPQGKFISVIKGEIFDVAVDYRVNSKTYGKHFKIILSEKNCNSIYIPPGFAHGFLGLKKENILVYGCTNYRHKESEKGIIWNDPNLKIKWPIKKPILSDKDKFNKYFKEYFK